MALITRWDLLHLKSTLEAMTVMVDEELGGKSAGLLPVADRVRVGLTFDADFCSVAAEVGVSERTVRRWASGESKPSRLAAAALKKAGLA